MEVLRLVNMLAAERVSLFASHQEPLHYLSNTSPGIIKKTNEEYPSLNKSVLIFTSV
jgi:hypothetical protein